MRALYEALYDALRRYRGALRRILGLAIPLAFLAMIVFLGFRTFGPRGTGLPPTQGKLELAHWMVPLLTSSLALGFAVMAIIQLFKPELRAAFHLREIARWLNGPPYEFLAIVSPKAEDALLELPIEQLTAQIQAASDAALTIRSPLAPKLVGLVVGPQDFPFDSPRDDPREQSRVGYIIQRRLDDLQIQARRRWRHLLRFMSLSVSLLLTTFLASILGLWHEGLVGTAFLVLLFSLLGAFFSSVARDVVAIIEKLRN
jgi:hypothetical protein